jgi:signal peptidase II
VGGPVRELQERRAVGTPLTAGARRRPLVVVAGIAAVVAVVVDQLTKSIALRRLEDGPVDVVWTLRFALAFNDGVAFSLGRGSGLAVIPVAVAVIVVMVLLARTMEGRLPGLCVGLIVGGAVGNVADRLFRGNGGAVVDFIDLQWWPVFNVADACIVCGGIGLGLLALLHKDQPPAASEA